MRSRLRWSLDERVPPLAQGCGRPKGACLVTLRCPCYETRPGHVKDGDGADRGEAVRQVKGSRGEGSTRSSRLPKAPCDLDLSPRANEPFRSSQRAGSP